MFSIVPHQKQYKTYTLSDDSANASLDVVPERGGIVTRWSVQGQELLYLDEERFANPKLTVRGGIPILFPICGNLPHDSYTYQQRTYHLKQHGFARDLPWSVKELTTEGCAAITLVLNSNEQTRAVYPWDFELVFTYQIKGNALEIIQHYTNHGEEVMPFCTGLHPYFWTPDKSQLRFEIPATKYRDQRTKEVDYFIGTFDTEQDEVDVALEQLTGLAATAIDAGRKLRLILYYNSTYSTVVFWTLKGKDYYCLEPWSAPRNAMNTGKHLIYLRPGETSQTLVRISATFF